MTSERGWLIISKMKTSITIFILCGVFYLYMLEDVGNFITHNLNIFKRSLSEQSEGS